MNARNHREGKQAKETDKLKPKGKLAGSEFTNCPDTDDAQPVERADLTYPVMSTEHGNPVSLPQGKAKP